MQLNYTLYEYCWCCCWRSAQYTIDIKCCIFLPSHRGSGQSAAPADALPTHSTHSTHITVQVYCQRPSAFIILGYTATSIWCALLYTSRKNEIQLFIHHRITDLLQHQSCPPARLGQVHTLIMHHVVIRVEGNDNNNNDVAITDHIMFYRPTAAAAAWEKNKRFDAFVLHVLHCTLVYVGAWFIKKKLSLIFLMLLLRYARVRSISSSSYFLL